MEPKKTLLKEVCKTAVEVHGWLEKYRHVYMKNDPALLTRNQLAKKLNLCPRSISNLQRKKAIPYIKLSPRCVRFSLASVLQALQKFDVKAV